MCAELVWFAQDDLRKDTGRTHKVQESVRGREGGTVGQVRVDFVCVGF
jgi:hypothetical protein